MPVSSRLVTLFVANGSATLRRAQYKNSAITCRDEACNKISVHFNNLRKSKYVHKLIWIFSFLYNFGGTSLRGTDGDLTPKPTQTVCATSPPLPCCVLLRRLRVISVIGVFTSLLEGSLVAFRRLKRCLHLLFYFLINSVLTQRRHWSSQ